MVPFNVAGLTAAFGGPAAYTKYLERLYANPGTANSGPHGTGAYVGNEPSEALSTRAWKARLRSPVCWLTRNLTRR